MQNESSEILQNFSSVLRIIFDSFSHYLTNISQFHSLITSNSIIRSVCTKNLSVFLKNFNLRMYIMYCPSLYQTNLQKYVPICYAELVSDEKHSFVSNERNDSCDEKNLRDEIVTTTRVSSSIDDEFNIESQLENIGCELTPEKFVTYDIFDVETITTLILNRKISCNIVGDKIEIISSGDPVLSPEEQQNKTLPFSFKEDLSLEDNMNVSLEGTYNMSKQIEVNLYFEKFTKPDGKIFVNSFQTNCKTYSKKCFNIYSRFSYYPRKRESSQGKCYDGSSSEDLGDYDLCKYSSENESRDDSDDENNDYNDFDYSDYESKRYLSSPPSIVHTSKRLKMY